jgi:hypothetical protein
MMTDGTEYSAMVLSSALIHGMRHTGRISLQRQSMIRSRRFSENRPKVEAVVYIKESYDVTGIRQAKCFIVFSKTSHNAFGSAAASDKTSMKLATTFNNSV